MKKLLACSILFASHACLGQLKYGFHFNFARLGYQCYEVDGLLSDANMRHQVLLTFNYTNALFNQNHSRNIVEFDQKFMKSDHETLIGPGYGIQLREKLTTLGASAQTHLYGALSWVSYHYNATFFENEYVNEQGFYHYTLAKHSERFTQNTLDMQLITNISMYPMNFDLGIGLLYSFAKVPGSISNYRDMDTFVMDYGHNGLGPVINLRVGVLF